MIQITADTRRAVVTNKELLTTGSAGIQVQFTLSEDWAGLAKVAVFRQGDEGEKVDCVLDSGLTCVVPHEVLTTADEVVFCGIYGSNGQGTIIIPTIWASLGVVRPGTEPNTPATATPTPEIWAQILNVAQDAEATADEAMSLVETGLNDLAALEATVETAEASRVLAEQSRVTAENQRVSTENSRVSAENTRVANENARDDAEIARAAAEGSRVAAENARASAERARVSAEQERVAAEQYREEKYAEYVETVSEYADNASASATAAAGSASNAATSAGTATTSAGQAASSATAAATSASQASGSAANAGSSASTATGAASTATAQAGIATSKASEAAASATAAAESATSAANAQTAAETAQDAAEDAQDAAETAAASVSASAAQIAQNTSDISYLNRQISDETTGLDTKAPVILETTSGAIASFNDGADGMPVKKLVAKIELVQAGTGNPSPDNDRPISGWTGCNIVGTGKNMLNPQTFAENGRFSYDPETGVFTGSNYPARLAKLGTFKESTQYTISFKYKGATTSSTFLYVKYTDGTASPERKISSKSYIPIVFVTDAGKTIDSLHIDYGSAIEIDIADFQIEEGTTASAYEPFGTTLPITWQSEAGTIYGGTVTLNEDGSADVVSNRAIIDLSTVTSFQGSGINAFYRTLSNTVYDLYDGGMNQYLISNRYKTVSYYDLANHRGEWGLYCIATRDDVARRALYVYTDGTQATKPEGYALLRLITPRTYHFSNIGQLKTFLGTNNVWCDTGAITELVYPADTKLFLTARDEEITGNIAPIENGTTASKAYAAGDYFFHDTKFCKALTAIASGATFTLGTNYQETTVAAELLAAQN